MMKFLLAWRRCPLKEVPCESCGDEDQVRSVRGRDLCKHCYLRDTEILT